jgi:hypothetical protein
MSIIGSSARISCTFKVSGTATDPTTVTFKQRTPAGVETTLVYGVDAAVQRTSAGLFFVDVTFGEAGKWTFRWKGTGAVIAADEKFVTVGASAFASP